MTKTPHREIARELQRSYQACRLHSMNLDRRDREAKEAARRAASEATQTGANAAAGGSTNGDVVASTESVNESMDDVTPSTIGQAESETEDGDARSMHTTPTSVDERQSTQESQGIQERLSRQEAADSLIAFHRSPSQHYQRTYININMNMDERPRQTSWSAAWALETRTLPSLRDLPRTSVSSRNSSSCNSSIFEQAGPVGPTPEDLEHHTAEREVRNDSAFWDTNLVNRFKPF